MSTLRTGYCNNTYWFDYMNVIPYLVVLRFGVVGGCGYQADTSRQTKKPPA